MTARPAVRYPCGFVFVSFKGCPTNHMMHRALRSKDYVPIQLAGPQEAARPFLEAFCEAQSKVSQPDWLQDTHADLFFLVQRVSNKPYDAPSLAQQRLRANPHSWLAYKRLPGPSWKHFAKRKVRCDSQTCCKIPMRICSFGSKGVPQAT